MRTVCLAHWREAEGRVRAEELEASGYRVRYDPVDAGVLLKALKTDPPSALVIDLSRSPAQGRDLAVALRIGAATRRLPLLFVGGSQEKVDTVRAVLPDAIFTSWDRVSDALRVAMDHPPEDPVVPESALAGYSGTPLPKKLGIKAGCRVLLAGAPPDFETVLGVLPADVKILRRYGGRPGLILWFVRSPAELHRGIDTWRSRVETEGIWIIWPKQRPEASSDLTANLVRKVGLASGLVDYKIAAIDRTWSGLKFSVRKREPGGD